jgi:hypothetical protein
MPTLKKLTPEEATRYRMRQRETEALAKLVEQSAKRMGLDSKPTQLPPNAVNRFEIKPRPK